MPFQNRVTPFGNIIAHESRGLLTGNRGILHDPVAKELHPTRRWTSKAWIYCLCDFKGKTREVFGKNGPNDSPGWTNLFFLDEATALAAGHRPCFYCQRERATEFKRAFLLGQGVMTLSAPDIDSILHAERLDGREKRFNEFEGDLPDGAMVTDGENAFLVIEDEFKRWSFSGYKKAAPKPNDLALLTPPSIVKAMRNGFLLNLQNNLNQR